MDKVVLITGGTSGLGKVAAEKLIAGAYQVVILSPTVQKLKKVAQEIGCDFVVGDVTNLGSVKQSVARVVEKYGRIDVLVNNAGIYLAGELTDNRPEAIKRVYEVNVVGLLWLTQAVIPLMRQQEGGVIINIGSQAGLRWRAQRAVYYSSKAAVINLTRCLQLELAPYNIKVVGVYPDLMKTELFRNAGVDKDMRHALEPQRVAEAIAYILSQPREALVNEIALKHPLDS